ncbi:MAG: RNA polymerase sigma factor [Planctomycetaceae bacterium]
MDIDDTLSAALASALARLAAGDLAARDTILELVAGRLRTLAHRMLARFPNVRRWDDTDDVFQNAALRLHRSLGQMNLTEPRSVLAVAATELHRELLDLARRHAGPMSYAANHGTNVVPGGAGDGRDVRHVDVAAAADEAIDRWAAFHRAVDALEPPQREVFDMVWYLGCDQKTVAAALGCSERTVKSRWKEAREAVRDRLDGEPPA